MLWGSLQQLEQLDELLDDEERVEAAGAALSGPAGGAARALVSARPLWVLIHKTAD
ncbi:MAG: hypothetical protein V3V67_03145 [Myxococcota bacterium]